jgi:ribosome recycling factor
MSADLNNKLNSQMNEVIGSYKIQLTKLRTGRANPLIFDGLTVNYYGSQVPLKQVAQISVPEARVLQIHPFEKSIISEIERSILSANLGVTPGNDGNVIRIIFPSLTEEKRKEIVKSMKKVSEDAKVQVRNLRRDFNELIKKIEKNKELSEDESKKQQDEVQNVTDKFIKQIDQLALEKEKELLTI